MIEYDLIVGDKRLTSVVYAVQHEKQRVFAVYRYDIEGNCCKVRGNGDVLKTGRNFHWSNTKNMFVIDGAQDESWLTVTFNKEYSKWLTDRAVDSEIFNDEDNNG